MAITRGHSFPSHAGFTGSAGRLSIKPHVRSAPKQVKVMLPPPGLGGGALGAGLPPPPAALGGGANPVPAPYRRGGRAKRG